MQVALNNHKTKLLMSHLINKILDKTLGVNLVRTKLRKINRNEESPILVEFVGASGVGKTTLYKNVFKQIKSKWIHITEFRRIFISHIDGKTTESLSCYQELAQHKIQSVVSRNYTGIDQMNLIKYFHTVLIDDSLVFLFNKNYNVISEDGLIHNFSDCLAPLFKSNKEAFECIIKNRAIIYCYTSAEVIAKRILEREQTTGQLRPQHKVNSFAELVNLQKKSLELKQQLIDFLSKHDIPTLYIDTSKPMTENVMQVKDFLTKLTHNK